MLREHDNRWPEAQQSALHREPSMEITERLLGYSQKVLLKVGL